MPYTTVDRAAGRRSSPGARQAAAWSEHHNKRADVEMKQVLHGVRLTSMPCHRKCASSFVMAFFAGDKFFDELRPLLFEDLVEFAFFGGSVSLGFRLRGFRVSARLSCRSVGCKVLEPEHLRNLLSL